MEVIDNKMNHTPTTFGKERGTLRGASTFERTKDIVERGGGKPAKLRFHQIKHLRDRELLLDEFLAKGAKALKRRNSKSRIVQLLGHYKRGKSSQYGPTIGSGYQQRQP